MTKKLHFLIPALILFVLPNTLLYSSAPLPGDTIIVNQVSLPPVIDGQGEDVTWDSADWYYMPYVWIPYGQSVDSSDFHGRFKVTWNKQSNLLYFLFEITDDKFVNGYEYSGNNGTYYLFDVVEIFLDENRSGGIHETNNNAFAYHITGGNSQTEYDAVDLWSNTRVNYKDHFPEFSRGSIGHLYFWEFSLAVLKDTYTPGADIPTHQSFLEKDHKMGFSVAYCDNDNSAINPQRDNFIASRYLSQANSNNSYINASLFGLMILKDDESSSSSGTFIPKDSEIQIYPNPIKNEALIKFNSAYSGVIDIFIYDSVGRLTRSIRSDKDQYQFQYLIGKSDLTKGMNYLKIQAGTEQVNSLIIY